MHTMSIRNVGGPLVVTVALFGALAGSPDTAIAQIAAIVDLGTLGGDLSQALAINASGQVVGSSTNGMGETHAFSWTAPGPMIDLGTLGGAFSEARVVNASGEVFGLSTDGMGASHVFSWTAPGPMIDLGPLGTHPNGCCNGSSLALAVNASGQVVGEGRRAQVRAFLWTAPGPMIDLGTLAPGILVPFSSAMAINDSGQVVGRSRNADDQINAFSWTAPGPMIDLGNLGVGSSANAINASGQVVGASNGHAFSWTAPGPMLDLGTLGGPSSQASAVNASGQIVGSASTIGNAETHAVLWTIASTPSLTGTGPATLWVGLKNSDDQGTSFDLRAEMYVNGTTLVAAGEKRCVAGITRNPAKAKEVTVPVDFLSQAELGSGAELSLKVFTRIGTKPDDSKCGGHSSAVGLRLYYDALSRQSRVGAIVTPPGDLADHFLRLSGSELLLDTTAPTSTQAQKEDSGPIKFAGGNTWMEIGTWRLTFP